VLAEEAHDGRQEDERSEHDDEHRDRCRDREAVEEAHAEDEQAKQGGDHRASRKQHGPAGGAHRRGDGLLGVLALEGVLPESVEDEQGVVDTDAEANHRSQLGGERGDVKESSD